MPTKKGSEAAKKAWKTIKAKRKTTPTEYAKECADKRQAKKEREEQEERERLEALRILEEMGKTQEK